MFPPLPPQELICLRAIRDVNVPKFLQDDLKLFNGIVSDLFPKIKEEPIDYGTLEESIRTVCTKRNLKDVDGERAVEVWYCISKKSGYSVLNPDSCLLSVRVHHQVYPAIRDHSGETRPDVGGAGWVGQNQGECLKQVHPSPLFITMDHTLSGTLYQSSSISQAYVPYVCVCDSVTRYSERP